MSLKTSNLRLLLHLLEVNELRIDTNAGVYAVYNLVLQMC